MNDQAPTSITTRIVAINQTEHWDIPEQWRDAIKGIYAVYVINMDEVTHCCEIAPSRSLEYIEHQFVLNDGYEYGSDLAEEISEWLLRNCGDSEDNSCYMWKSYADSMPFTDEHTWPIRDGMTSDAVMEEVNEYYMCNSPCITKEME
jgi:hypothetical protein